MHIAKNVDGSEAIVTPPHHANVPLGGTIMDTVKDPLDNYLWLVLVDIRGNHPACYVTWEYNGCGAGGFGGGDYYDTHNDAVRGFAKRVCKRLDRAIGQYERIAEQRMTAAQRIAKQHNEHRHMGGGFLVCSMDGHNATYYTHGSRPCIGADSVRVPLLGHDIDDIHAQHIMDRGA